MHLKVFANNQYLTKVLKKFLIHKRGKCKILELLAIITFFYLFKYDFHSKIYSNLGKKTVQLTAFIS